MSRILPLTLAGLFVLVAISARPAAWAVAQTSPAAQPQVQVPSLPDPAPVTVSAASTAFLALDLLGSNCSPRPGCVASLPAIASGVTAARAGGALIVYSNTPGGNILPDVLMMPSDPVVTSGADRFYNTDLDNILKQNGISTVVLVGTSSDGAVLYTAFGAAERGYTVVVAEDGLSAGTDFANFLTEWQLLNGAGTSNPQNTPLKAMSATLSRTDLITYK